MNVPMNRRAQVGIGCILALVLLQGFLRLSPILSSFQSTYPVYTVEQIAAASNVSFSTDSIQTHANCSFRYYEDSRLYGLTSKKYPPAFLRSSHYIYGKPPLLLPLDTSNLAFQDGKVCIHTPAEHLRIPIQYQDLDQERATMVLEQPRTDGTNPTIVSIERLQQEERSGLADLLLKDFPTAAYLVTNTFKSASQCNYDRSKKGKGGKPTIPSTKQRPYKELAATPPGRQHRNEVDLVIADLQLRTLYQTTIMDRIPRKGSSGNLTLSADDARLLVHDGALWLTSKRYNDHGGNGMAVYVNKLQTMKESSADSTPRWIIASNDEFVVCCGRNFMALSARHDGNGIATSLQNHRQAFEFLTWPDPIWVQSFDPTTQYQNQDSTKEEEIIGFKTPNRTSKSIFGKSSHYHGTSGFLLYLPATEEYLGVGHIHRERKWAKDVRVDARFGHHYTHSFFTMTSRPPYQLTKVSPEFLFPSKSLEGDADVVQFASGLEWVPSTKHQLIAIGYGINDCESAIVQVSWKTVESLLRPVHPGDEIASVMSNMTREDFVRRASSSIVDGSTPSKEEAKPYQ